ncbi:MAG: hypothetical protein Q7O66_06080 [Dehalococcoidia bacterium]|nr:hypothetical protein [Dehalococcoidia bacterium]
MQSRRATYVVRRFELKPFLRFGLVIGGAVGLFPSLIAALAITSVVSTLRRFMESASHVSELVPVINKPISFDFVNLLGLTGNLNSLAFLDDHAWLFGTALFVFFILVTSVTCSLAAMIGAIVYNGLNRSIGGLRVELEDTLPNRH